MQAKSIQGDHLEDIKTRFQDVKEAPFHPTLAFVFLSIQHDIGEVCRFFRENDIAVFGATTNGEFIDENIEKGSITVLLLDLESLYFHVYFSEYHDSNYLEVTQQIAQKARKIFSKPVFILAGSHMGTDAEELLRGFQKEMGAEVEVFGCMAGDDFTFDKQYVFTNEHKSDQGVVVLALDGNRIEVGGRALCGWKPMGTEKTVTRSDGNRVYSIDGIPALDITAKFGGIKDVTKENKDLLLEMATLCPLQLQREDGTAVMRPGLVVNWEDRSFFCSGKVPQGSKVKFSLPPDFDAIEEVIQGCRELKEEMREVDAIIYFTCAGRLLTFGPLMSEEIQGIKEVWNAPMIGMFSSAELGRAKGGDLEMHNLSSNVVVIKENK